MPTRSDYEKWLEEKGAKVIPFPIDPGLLKSAAVSAEKLTGNAEWDKYLTQLQALLQESQLSAQQWLERLGGALTERDVKECQLNYQACLSRATTLQEVMQLPQNIIQANHDAGTSLN